jgi:hypothetical protein
MKATRLTPMIFAALTCAHSLVALSDTTAQTAQAGSSTQTLFGRGIIDSQSDLGRHAAGVRKWQNRGVALLEFSVGTGASQTGRIAVMLSQASSAERRAATVNAARQYVGLVQEHDVAAALQADTTTHKSTQGEIMSDLRREATAGLLRRRLLVRAFELGGYAVTAYTVVDGACRLADPKFKFEDIDDFTCLHFIEKPSEKP